MRLLNEVLLNAGDASVNFQTPHGLVAYVFGYNIQLIIAGTPVGVVSLQGSSDPVPEANFKVPSFTVANWTDIAGSSQNVTGAGTLDYNMADSYYNWVRVIYTSTSGTGTITVRLNTKGF
jgi:hypothetical protein